MFMPTEPVTQSRPLRILIADDHPAFRAGLRSVLAAIARTEVVGEVATGRGAISAAQRLRPDLVLMDVDMPDVNGIEASRQITTSRPDTKILMLTVLEDGDTILAAMRAGARGYLLKGSGLEDITRAVDAVRSGNAIFGPEIAGPIISTLTSPAAETHPFPELTEREREVLNFVADGRSNSWISRELGLSIKTVRNYLSRIFAKLHVTNRAEAAVRARRSGLGR